MNQNQNLFIKMMKDGITFCCNNSSNSKTSIEYKMKNYKRPCIIIKKKITGKQQQYSRATCSMYKVCSMKNI